MDSKIKKLTVLAMLGIMFIVAAVVVLFNYRQFTDAGKKQETQSEEAAVDVHHAALRVERDTTFLLQIVAHPQVVVAREEMHLHAHVRQLANLSQQAGVALGHHGLVLVPEVKDVAEQIDGGGFVLDAVEEVHQPALLHTCMGYG